jgi:zinc/manganese transport system permease protein
LPYVAVLGAVVLVALYLIRRPLLFSSLSAELATARGVRLRLVGSAFMVMLAVAVGLSSIVIGSILSTALLIGPAASALKASRSLVQASVLAVVFGVVATWLGITFAYDSFYWFPSRRGLPVSFFVVMVIVVEFGVVTTVHTFRARRNARLVTLISSPRALGAP